MTRTLIHLFIGLFVYLFIIFMDIQDLFKETIANKASDLHLIPDLPPVLRVDGSLLYLNKLSKLSSETVETMIFSILHNDQKDLLLTNKELNFSIGYG